MNWVQRQPSYSFDKLSVWDDILTSRLLYIDLYKLLFKDDYAVRFDQTAGSDIKDIGAILYAQCAKGAFKMGLYDSCDRYLKTCLE